MHNISNTASYISRRMITVFLVSSQQDKKLNKIRGSISWSRMIDFYIDSKSIKHFCKLLIQSRDFLYFNLIGFKYLSCLKKVIITVIIIITESKYGNFDFSILTTDIHVKFRWCSFSSHTAVRCFRYQTFRLKLYTFHVHFSEIPFVFVITPWLVSEPFVTGIPN